MRRLGSLAFKFRGSGRGERQLYKSRWGWQKKIVFPFVVAARKTILSIRKRFVDAKEKNENYSLYSRSKRCALDAARANRDDSNAMKIFCAFVFLGIVPAIFGAEPALTVFINGNIETVNERQEHAFNALTPTEWFS